MAEREGEGELWHGLRFQKIKYFLNDIGRRMPGYLE
jgi:hypothetical protein